MKLLWKKLGCLMSCLLTLGSSASAEETELEKAMKKGVKSLGTAVTIAETYLNTRTVLQFQTAASNGSVSESQIKQAQKAIDDLGSQAATAAAMASGGGILAGANAMQAGPLISIATSENQQLRALNRQDYWAAVARNDMNAVAKFGAQADAQTRERANYKPEYGSFSDSLARMARSVGIPSSSQMDAKLKVMKSQISNLMKEYPSAETINCPEMDWYLGKCNRSSTPVSPEKKPEGVGKWRTFSQSINNKPSKIDTKMCFDAPQDLPGFVQTDVDDYISAGCSVQNLKVSSEAASYAYACKSNSAVSGRYLYQKNGDRILGFKKEGMMVIEEVYGPCSAK